MKKIKSIIRVYLLGLLGIFSIIYYVLSFKLEYTWYSISEIPVMTLYSSYVMFCTSSYLIYKRHDIKAEYISLQNDYLNWLGKQNSLIVFLVSIGVNLIITVCQIGLIEIFLHFTSISIATGSDITLFFVNILNFFIIRTYVFKYEGKNYIHQVSFYTIISIIGLIVNYWTVEWIVGNFNLVNSMFFGLPNVISKIIGYKSTPQFFTSAFVGWVWFICHKKITFKK